MKALLVLFITFFSISEPETVEMTLFVDNGTGTYTEMTTKSIALNNNEASAEDLEKAFEKEILKLNAKDNFFIANAAAMKKATGSALITQRDFMMVASCCYGISEMYGADTTKSCANFNSCNVRYPGTKTPLGYCMRLDYGLFFRCSDF